MKETTTVWLVRHGACEGTDGRCYGRLDVPLSREGVSQAGNLAKHLRRESLDCIYSSPSRRALDTARIVAEPHRAAIRTLDGLAEIDFGDFEGLSYEEIQTRFPEAYRTWMNEPAVVRFPNGEDFQAMRKRVLHSIETVITGHSGKSVAVVTHGGVVRLLVAHALSIPDSHIFRLTQEYAAINRIDYTAEGAVVRLVNGRAGGNDEVHI
jgi:alpha-ribazole phosphatase